MPFAFVIFGAALVSEDGSDGLEIKPSTAAVNEGLKDLFHPSAQFKYEIPAVFDLVVRVSILKPAPLLLLKIEGKTEAGGINPTLADLA
jgi:hypothetical protein